MSFWRSTNNRKGQWPVPQVVILPGPHMTATTSIQMCMVQWTMAKTGDPLLDDWLWAVPDPTAFKKHNLISQGAIKNFSPLFGLLSGQRAFVFQQAHQALSQHAMKIYKEPMMEAWKNGKRIVYGSEEMDFVTSDLESVDPDKIMNGVFDILPWNDENRKLSKGDIEAVVLHKGSRIDHLLEIWQEVELDSNSFRDFLSKREDILSSVDGLGLAWQYLARGVRVSVVDTSGVDGMADNNICHAVSCDVLGVPCSFGMVDSVQWSGKDVSKGTHDMQGYPPGDLGLSQDEMQRIDEIMNEYDCGLQRKLEKFSSKFRILHQQDLFSKCSKTPLKERPFSWVVSEIQKIVAPTKGADVSRNSNEVGLIASDPPQVVVFPGSHGSASTNLQHCFATWSKEKDVIGDWTWAAPNATALQEVNLRPVGPNKRFAPLFATLSGQKSFYADKQKEVDLKEVVSIYEDAMQQAWRQGKKLVYGSEEMDWAVSMIETMDTKQIMDGVFDVLPFGDNNDTRALGENDVVAVIPYESRRVDHLKAIWQGVDRASKASFRNFLVDHSNLFSTVNSLGLAKAYLDRGVRTTILDMSGVSSLNVDQTNECHVVACDVMKLGCDPEKLQIQNISRPDLIDTRIARAPGTDPGELAMSSNEISMIESVMKEFDCGLREDLLAHEKSGRLRILQHQDLFRDCPVDSPKRRFSWMIHRIQSIVADADAKAQH